MKIIKDEEEIKRIIEWNKRVVVKNFKVFNTPWAKDKTTGERDTENLALFIEFEDKNTKTNNSFWLISEKEFWKLKENFEKISSHNREFDSRAKRYWGDKK